MKSIVAVRPYHAGIRAKVFAVLEALGFEEAGTTIIPAGTSDDDVLAVLGTTPVPDALLVPFHAHRDGAGQQVEGLTVLLRARRELPAWATVPVMMPVSQVALGGVLLKLNELAPADVAGIHVVTEPELDDTDAVVRKLRAAGM